MLWASTTFGVAHNTSITIRTFHEQLKLGRDQRLNPTWIQQVQAIKTNYTNPRCHIYRTQSSTLQGDHESKDISLASLAIGTFNSRVGKYYKINHNFFQKAQEIAKTFV